MANHCYNTISFFGNAKVIKQVNAWRKEIDEYEPTKDDPYCMRAIREIFYPGVALKAIDYGTKWLHPDDSSTGAGKGQLGLQSAWGPPDRFLEHLASSLFELDPNVVVEDLFNTEDGTIGFRYVTVNADGEFYVQSYDVTIEYDDHDEPEDAEAAADALFDEYKSEYLTDLVSDVPGTFKNIKKFVPDLVEDWDELKQSIKESWSEDDEFSTFAKEFLIKK